MPPKIISSILAPRRVLVLCSPMTHKMASERLDLPLPLGPTMAVMSLPNWRMVLSGKDLKPWISSDFRYTVKPRRLNLLRISLLYQQNRAIASISPPYPGNAGQFFRCRSRQAGLAGMPDWKSHRFGGKSPAFAGKPLDSGKAFCYNRPIHEKTCCAWSTGCGPAQSRLSRGCAKCSWEEGLREEE